MSMRTAQLYCNCKSTSVCTSDWCTLHVAGWTQDDKKEAKESDDEKEALDWFLNVCWPYSACREWSRASLVKSLAAFLLRIGQADKKDSGMAALQLVMDLPLA